MSSTGSIAPNFHEGTRSEYLAQYVFSAFGTSIPVPHPEDSEIDLYCTLGERIGNRLHVRNYYFVQVKSEKTEIAYGDAQSVHWLLGHRYPLLLCCIDKRTQDIEVYQTLRVTMCAAKDGIEAITLIPADDPKGFGPIEARKRMDIRLGAPILKFNIAQITGREWADRCMSILEWWIELDQYNIDHKAMGFTSFVVPDKYETNVRPEQAKKVVGNFAETTTNPEQQQRFYDAFLKLLSQLVMQATATRNYERFDLLSRFAGKLCSSPEIKASWGLWLLTVAVNTGGEYLKHPYRIVIQDAAGKKVQFPRIRIIDDSCTG
jgi:hypothetical protein